ncbi:MAG: sigma-70 family RNA polymerase sigma factor [Planctomycetes bacterium]|nr:sigma-70 family RNA polymerase sigma factor [Planctomycetota bacterium]MBL7007594.1 sigma-70 family RNA polymerase sigma factor [Planctomycetota bacterium]
MTPQTPQEPKARTQSRPEVASNAPPAEDQIAEWGDLVWFVVNRIRPRLPMSVSDEELYSAGMVGLMTASRSYDPSRGAEFKTYAYHRIRGAILDELRRMDFLPRSQREKARREGYEPPSFVAIPTDEDGQESLVADPVAAALENRELVDALREQILQLPEKMRVVMSLYYSEGLRMREIGERLHLTESRVSQIHSNAVARLRRVLRPKAGD